MNLATKTILALAIVTIAAMATTTNEELVLGFSKTQLKNHNIDYSNLKVLETKKVTGNWEIIKISFDVNDKGKIVHSEEQIVINDGYIVSDAINAKTMQTIRGIVAPQFPSDVYTDSRLIFGSKNAKTKIALFSDPLCPFCKEEMKLLPKLKGKDVAVYLYHLPLAMHPASKEIVKNIIATKNNQDVILKIYSTDTARKISRSTNSKKINNWFNEISGKTISLKDINTSEINKELEEDMALANLLKISGTPTVFINGKLDKNRMIFRKMLN